MAALIHLRQFNVNARPYVTFVSYFRNDSYTSDFDLARQAGDAAFSSASCSGLRSNPR